MQVRFLDLVAPHPYHKDSISERPMGGTEATVIRVANALERLGHETRIDQANEKWGDITVVLRNPDHLSEGDVLWMHDLGAHLITDEQKEKIATAPFTVCASHFHQVHLREVASGKIGFIYNPVDPNCKPLEKDPNKVVFLSSPHKDLERSLQVFAEMLKLNPNLHLYILNPGYFDTEVLNTSKVTTIGPVLHEEAMRHLGEASLLLHANKVFPESMGIVYAEAAACETPVLTLDVGAAKEIVGPNGLVAAADVNPEELASGYKQAMETKVTPNTQYALEAVALEWEKRLLALI